MFLWYYHDSCFRFIKNHSVFHHYFIPHLQFFISIFATTTSVIWKHTICYFPHSKFFQIPVFPSTRNDISLTFVRSFQNIHRYKVLNTFRNSNIPPTMSSKLFYRNSKTYMCWNKFFREMLRIKLFVLLMHILMFKKKTLILFLV